MTEAPRSPKTPRFNKGKRRIYPHVVYARVTEQEWLTIKVRADGVGLSMSRYLVETGLREKPPLSPGDRARLQFLLYLFRRAFVSINQVACDRLVVAVGGNDTRQLLCETASLMEQLTQELTQRICETDTCQKAPDPPDTDGEP